MSDKKCLSIEHESLLVGSWECCKCATLNGFHRDECKFCQHVRCYYPPVIIEATEDLKELPAEVPGGTIDKSKLN